FAAQSGSFNEYAVMPRLIVDTMASPWYPRPAIRQAKEGYAVACFLVNPDGFVRDPHFLELSDPLFEQPARGALQRSHYQSWDESLPSRPACRTFDFHLDGKRF
ncbi:MAG: energy transducer TonB, partial [Gammaproteobacteria bacterium]